MSMLADSFKPPCVLGYYPCLTNPGSKDCAVMTNCSKDLFFCKFVRLGYADGTDISCKAYSFTNRHCTHGGGSCSRRRGLEQARITGFLGRR